MATTATIQPINLSELFRDAWRLARASAVASACSARACLGSGLRMAWARARAALASRKAAQVLRERISVNDKLMAEVQAEIDMGWGIFRREPSVLYAQLDCLHADGVALREELAELEAPAVPPAPAPAPAPAPVQMCLIEHIASLPPVAPAPRRFETGAYTTVTVPGAGDDGEDEMTVLLTDEDGTVRNLGTVLIYCDDFDGPQAALAVALRVIEEAAEAEPVASQPEPAPAPGPDLSTVEGLAAVLVGRRVVMPLMGWDVPYEVTGVERWESNDGTLVRDYVNLDVTGVKPSKGPVKLYLQRNGGGRGNYLDTQAGRAFWAYGVDCNSGSKRNNADAIVREILAPIAL